jgi:hypothetical protein
MRIGSKGSQAPLDNYAQFIEQMNAASNNLGARRESLNRTLAIVCLLFEQNELGLKVWEERRAKVGKLVAKEVKSKKQDRALRELLDVARNMESMFLNRMQRMEGKQAGIRSQHDEISKSLLELARSKLKLNSSRILSRERENLNRAIADLAGTPEGAASAPADLGLRNDLNEARTAIVQAEALLELKGN